MIKLQKLVVLSLLLGGTAFSGGKVNAETVMVGGYMDSSLSTQGAGKLTMMAITGDMIDEVLVMANGLDTGVRLSSAGNNIWVLPEISLNAIGGSPQQFMLELVPVFSMPMGEAGVWPYLNVTQGATPTPTQVVTPTPDAFPELSPVTDMNPDHNIVEVDIEAKSAQVEIKPGKMTTVWTYNGTLPGPIIRAKVGNRIIVHFTNNLSQETTIHWHGVRLPNAMDGAMAVQTPVQPGGTFDYEFTVTDPGLFWFHPHAHAADQQAQGLYGALFVEGANDPQFDRHRVMVLSDILLNNTSGAFISPTTNAASNHMAAMQGYSGNYRLVNGMVTPSLTWRSGTRERWSIVNASIVRFYNLSIPGHTFYVIGGDSGLIESPQERQQLLITPGERLDVVVSATAAPGTTAEFINNPYARGHGAGTEAASALAHITYSSEPTQTLSTLPTMMEVVPTPASPVRTRTFSLSETMDHMTGEMEFFINNEKFPNVTMLHGTLGETEIWEFQNTTEMDHPMHIHGFRFQVLERDGVAEPFAAWKDTVNVRQMENVRVSVLFDGYPGMWMYHCHIVQHAELGMMGEIEVAQ